MLIGRAVELEALEALAGDVLAGRGRAVALRGEPGIGKTTLLDALVERCGRDVTVVRTRGVESESELAFSGLSDLLGPVVEDLAALPEPQAAALAAALALGPPRPGDRLALCVATLGLLRAAGRRRPVIAVVDDIQWLDAPSRECVLYAARRAGGHVAVAVTAHDHEDAEVDRMELPSLQLGRLPPDAALELLAHVAPDLAPPVARALADAGAGNPLALVELPVALTPEQRAGVAGLDVPLAPGGRLHAAFTSRIAGLGADARRALLVAATHAGTDMTAISAACASLGSDVGLLADAERRGLVRIGAGRVEFTHPLVRGAAYRAPPAAERRAAHRALADALRGEPRAWHLAAAAVGRDESVAAELEAIGAAAAARRGFASASAAFERAARLSADAGAGARRLLTAGQTAGAAGQADRALALLHEASGMAVDGDLRARAEHLRGLIMVWCGSVEPATELLVGEAERAATHDPALAAAMLADAATASTATSSYHQAEGLAERAVALLGDDGDAAARAHVLASLGWTLVLRGQTPRARDALDEAERLAEGLDPLAPGRQWQHLLLRSRIPTGDLERARAESVALSDRARDAGALATLGGTLIVAADAGYRLGDWELTDAATREAIALAADTGQHVWHGYALTFRARLAAARGDEDESRRAALTARGIAESEEISSGLRFVHGALGFLELSLDRVDPAIAELETVDRLVEGSGLEEPTTVPWAPDLVEAYLRAGRAEDAVRVHAMLARQAASTGTAFAGAALARCSGMIREDFDAAFAEALAFDDRCPMPFERSRTLFAYGRRLHRARRRVEARSLLQEALAGFERLGAAAWARQARNELRAAGARRRAPRDGRLTPQELRVADAVKRGASNREIAAELFLSPKTIEFHLRQIYRKLGARSRSELVAMLGRAGELEHER
jgi:DNA-binding CsgD family transcriptional regulator